MIYQSILACVILISPSAPAQEQVETLEQLRQRFQQDRDILAKTENPALGSDGFAEKVRVWANAYQKSQESARALIPPLLEHWLTLPVDGAEAQTVRQEITTACKSLAGHPRSNQANIAKSFLARTVWPLLADDKATGEQLDLLAELTEPQPGVRTNDRIARAGRPTEPLGWDVQAAHALALIRKGNEELARDEITILHVKVSINYKANPKGSLDYGPEAGEDRHRSYLDYLQLCEVLHGLQAAISKDHEAAAERIKQARRLREALSPEASRLEAEVGRRAEANKD